jgi:uncharacterized protein (DUF433 family)
MGYTITLSERTFKRLAEEAERVKASVSDIAEKALAQYFSPPHPYIEMVQAAGGPSARIKGTRIPVFIIVNYMHIGETPESLAKDTLPHLSLAAIYDALSYYHDHKEEIDKDRAENTEEASKKYLRERLGEEGFKRITGQIK